MQEHGITKLLTFWQSDMSALHSKNVSCRLQLNQHAEDCVPSAEVKHEVLKRLYAFALIFAKRFHNLFIAEIKET